MGISMRRSALSQTYNQNAHIERNETTFIPPNLGTLSFMCRVVSVFFCNILEPILRGQYP